MNKQKEMTARNTSVGADDRQSLHVTNYSITNPNGNINAFLLKGGGRLLSSNRWQLFSIQIFYTTLR